MNTTENNKLIAEFLGYEPNTNGVYPIVCINEGKGWHLETMKYHFDWNWLMEVVEKIESIIFDNNNSFNVTIGSTNYCVIQDSNGDTYESVEDYGETKLLTTYKAIVKFIKWYNENSR